MKRKSWHCSVSKRIIKAVFTILFTRENLRHDRVEIIECAEAWKQHDLDGERRGERNSEEGKEGAVRD